MNEQQGIEIQRGDVTVRCTDVAQAAALVNALVALPMGAGTAPASSEMDGKTRRPRKAKAATEEGPARSGRGAVKAKVLAFVAKHPVVDLGELSRHIYGEDEPRRRASAGTALRGLVFKGEVKKLASGEYRVA